MVKHLLIKEKISAIRLSKWKLGLLSLAALCFLTLVISCEEQITEPVVAASLEEVPVDARLVGNEAVIRHDNPQTGEPYTEEELAALSYDPAKSDHFLPGKNVTMDVVMKLEPSKIEVLLGDNKVFEELVVPAINDENEYVVSFSSNFDDLNFGPGDEGSLSFVITYNNAAGNEAASVQTLDFVFYMANIRPRAFGFLKKQNGEILELKTLVNGAIVVENSTYGHLFTFDGEDDYVEIIDSDALSFRYTEDFSVSLWVKITEDVSDPSIIGDKDWGSGGNKGFTMFLTHERWKINLADGNGNRLDVTVSDAMRAEKKVDDGKWHHLVASLDRDGDVVIYQDGVELGRADMSAVGDMNSGFPINLGQDGTGTYGDFFPGQSGEPIIYDYALTAAEVAALQNSVQYRTSEGENFLMTVDDLSSGVYTAEDINGTDRLVRTFNGDPEYLTIMDELTVTDQVSSLDFRYDKDFSVALWVNTTATNSDPSIIGDKDWGSGSNPGFVLAFRGNSSWKLNVADTNRDRVDVNGGIVNDGLWHLIGATFDRDGNATVYQDGVEMGSSSLAGLTGEINSGLPIRIAQEGTATYGDWFEGKVSNTYIFDHALTAAEMLALYNE